MFYVPELMEELSAKSFFYIKIGYEVLRDGILKCGRILPKPLENGYNNSNFCDCFVFSRSEEVTNLRLKYEFNFT